LNLGLGFIENILTSDEGGGVPINKKQRSLEVREHKRAVEIVE
jgi:hypothetical protein